MEAEKVFYQDSNVLVTQARLIVFNKTYAMRNISSVSMFVKHKTLTKFFSLALLLVGLFGIFQEVYTLGFLSTIVAGILLFLMKDEFIVQISSNSGDNNVLVSKNKDYIQKVVNAVNEAIIYRG